MARICLVASTYPRMDDDVAVPWLRETVRRLRDRGHDIMVLAPAYKGSRSHQIDGVPIHRFRYFLASREDLTHDSGAPSKVHKTSYKLLGVLYVLFGALALRRLTKGQNFEIVHIHWPFPHANFLMFMGRRQFATVLNFHGAELMLAGKSPLFARNLAKWVRRADAIIANSSYTASAVKALAGNTKIEVIPYGSRIVEDKVPASRPNDPRILFVGRLIERKGAAYLLEAHALLLKQGRKVKLTIVGSGMLLETLRAKASELDTTGAVEFLTNVGNDEIASVYSSSTVFVLPAIVDSKGDTEGLGVVLVEALSFGLPVVASNVGGIPDVIRDGETGLLVEEKNPEALAQAIGRLLDNSALAEELVRKGQDHIEKRFSWPVVTNHLEKVYAEVIDRRKRS